ncbi:hypothetical protein DSO57_1031296 [Entomophthora muscae]|uniref:Uncharacterized protein n=1 Tax=Entomophthora muscae TaxID=34485 RepID=A0ACC2RRW0_9FUNG|nr:hypothetical protein DSO57_1031296 [Entomophthora muscae]
MDLAKPSDNGEEKKVVYNNLTLAEKQKMQIDKLMAKPDQPLELPKPRGSVMELLKPPKDFMTNIPGSSAGAGSGDFHIYRAHRRREYTRIRLMELETKKEQENAEFQAKRDAIRKEEEMKTAKRRAKRQKRKQGTKDKPAPPDSPAKPTDPQSPQQFKMRPNPDALKDLPAPK